jgi:hypothetical protein
MTQTISVDTSALVDGQGADAADVTTPLGDLETALENLLNGLQAAEQVLFLEISTPSNPAAGRQKLYISSADNKPYLLNSAGTATQIDIGLTSRVAALEGLPNDLSELDEASDYTISVTSFADIDATDLAVTITTAGGPVLVGYSIPLITPNNGQLFFDIDVDGARLGGDDGLERYGNASSVGVKQTANLTTLITGLSADSHTFKVQAKVSAGSATLYAGAGTSGADMHPRFWAIELAGT